MLLGRWDADRGPGLDRLEASAQGRAAPGRGPDEHSLVNFRGERRSNATHDSQTDPEAKLLSKGRESKRSLGGHALMENCNGLCVDIEVWPVLETESEAAKGLHLRQARKRVRPTTLAAEKGYLHEGLRRASAKEEHLAAY